MPTQEKLIKDKEIVKIYTKKSKIKHKEHFCPKNTILVISTLSQGPITAEINQMSRLYKKDLLRLKIIISDTFGQIGSISRAPRDRRKKRKERSSIYKLKVAADSRRGKASPIPTC